MTDEHPDPAAQDGRCGGVPVRPSAVDNPHQCPSRRAGHATMVALVGLGGAAGTAVRALLAHLMPHELHQWPTATLLVNLCGALALGLLLGRLALSADAGWRQRVRVGVGTGFMGGLTTYSTFMIEVAHWGAAGVPYWCGSVAGGLVAATAGLWLAGRWHRARGGEAA